MTCSLQFLVSCPHGTSSNSFCFFVDILRSSQYVVLYPRIVKYYETLIEVFFTFRFDNMRICSISRRKCFDNKISAHERFDNMFFERLSGQIDLISNGSLWDTSSILKRKGERQYVTANSWNHYSSSQMK